MIFPLVMKFGGAGLADGAAVSRVCDIVAERAPDRPLVVVSAHQGVTSLLERCARRAAAGEIDVDAVRIRHRGLLRQLELDPELLNRHVGELGQILLGIREKGALLAEELDFALSFGERMSARIVAAALRRRGLLATPVDAFDLGLTTDSCHGQAQPLPGFEASLRGSLEGIPGIPVVTGFLAQDSSGNLTTLGRNGSDLTAALVAHAVGAERLEFWKNVPGIMTADPGLVSEARPIDRLPPRLAGELAFHGAAVLHPRALTPELTAGLAIRVRDVDHPDRPGTRIESGAGAEGPVAITGAADLVGVSVRGDGGEGWASLFALLHAHHVQPRFLHSEGEHLTVWAPREHAFEVVARELSSRAALLPPVASVVVVGGGRPRAGSAALELLVRAGIEPRRAFLDGRGTVQAFLLDLDDRGPATRALHAGLLEPALEVRPKTSGRLDNINTCGAPAPPARGRTTSDLENRPYRPDL